MSKKTKVVISRKRWARGQSQGGNRLLLTRANVAAIQNSHVVNPTIRVGNMCCLGFTSLKVGATKAAIRGQAMPCDVYDRGSRRRALPGLSRLVNQNTSWGSKTQVLVSTGFSNRASKINDSKHLSDAVKETRLVKLASENGFTFKFVA